MTTSVFDACARAMAWERHINALDRDPFDDEVDDADEATMLAYRTRPVCALGIAVLAATYLAKEDPDDPAVRAVLETIRDAANALAYANRAMISNNGVSQSISRND